MERRGESHTQPLSREYRGFLVLLLDQSRTMQEEVQVGGKIRTLGQVATATINSLLSFIVGNAPLDDDTNERKDWCDFLVLGYGHEVSPLLGTLEAPVALPALAHRSRKKTKVVVQTDDGDFKEEDQWNWIEYAADGQRT